MAVGGKVNFEVDDGTFIGQRDKCEMCNKREHDGYCSQCELYICQKCFDKHMKSKSCRDHVLLQDPHESSRHDSAIRFETCNEHKQQEVKAYCTEHKCCVCIECILLRHKSCEWEYIIEASNRFQNSGDLTRLLEEVQGLEYTLDKCVEALDKHTKTAKTSNKDFISNIESFSKSLADYIAVSKQQVLDDAKVQESAHQQKLDKLKADVQSLGSLVEAIITEFRDEDMLHKRFILAVETLPKVARIQNEIAAIDCNNAITDYTFLLSHLLKCMMSKTRPIGRLTDASQTEDDEEDDVDIKLKTERDRCIGLEQQLEENQKMITKMKKDMYDMEQTHANVMSKLNKDLADSKQNYHIMMTKMKKDMYDMEQTHANVTSKLNEDFADSKQNYDPTVTLSCGHKHSAAHLGENKLRICRTCGIINGDQPNGTFTTNDVDNMQNIEMSFTFPNGTQTELNRSTGRPYSGKTVTGYLRNDTEGKVILKMMNIAFQRKCFFTIDNHGNITNGIELYASRTSKLFLSLMLRSSNYRMYIGRVRQQLAMRGIMESDATCT